MKTLKIAALAGALAVAGASHALAGDYAATYTGTVSAYDYADGSPALFEEMFGYGATDITGFAFSAAVHYTTDIAGTAFTDDTYGGSGVVSSYPQDAVISSVVFTINNDPTHSFTFNPIYYANVESAPGFHESAGYDFQNQFQAFIATDTAAPSDVSTPFSATGTGFDPVYDAYNYVTDGNETLVWDTTRVSVTAAPEPGTWALMLAGVGLTGLALRRRTRAALAAA